MRSKLKEYYLGDGRNDPIEIVLPKGAYVPMFLQRPNSISPLVSTPAGEPAKPVPKPVDPPAPFPWSRSRGWRLYTAGAVALGILMGALANFQRPLRLASIQQVTFDGAITGDYLVAAESWIYTSRGPGLNDAVPIRIPAGGGEPAKLHLSSGNWRFFDVNERGDLLLGQIETSGGLSLWTWHPDRAPARAGGIRVSDAAWMENGRVAAIVSKGDEDGKSDLALLGPAGIERRIGLPGTAEWPRFSRSHSALALTLADRDRTKMSIWQMALPNGKPEPLTGMPEGAGQGAWSRNGSVFSFVARRDRMADRWDLWAIDERPLHRHTPVRLTSGLLDFESPIPSPDGSRIYALGRKEHKELVRYDVTSHQFTPFLGGIDAIEPDFSPDGQWVAYVTSSGRTLYAMHPDGSAKRRLTQAQIQAVEPHWSPDGTRITFAGIVDGKWRVYVIPAAGGAPAAVAAGAPDQGIPTWSADGSKIVFGEVLYRRPRSEMTIHVLDIVSGDVTELPGSKGLWSPRWSPDGKQILATTTDLHELRLFDTTTQSWRLLLRAKTIDHAGWSRDSQHIHFAGRGVAGYDQPGPLNSLYRVAVNTGTVEAVVKLEVFRSADPYWFGEAPDGSPLALERISTDDIYVLNLER